MIDEFIELLLCELFDRYSLESHCRHRFFYDLSYGSLVYGLKFIFYGTRVNIILDSIVIGVLFTDDIDFGLAEYYSRIISYCVCNFAKEDSSDLELDSEVALEESSTELDYLSLWLD